VIRFEWVGFRYSEQAPPVLSGVDLEIDEGELCLVAGRTGSGKSTLLRAVNGLVPHFTGGILAGRVTVDGRDTRDHPPRDLADVVGYVGQDPRAGFVTDVVEEELAYGMESLGLPPAVMRRRVEETLDLLGLEGVRDRPLATLSGGQAQRVAIGSVLAAHPRVLVLDEPTSALDPAPSSWPSTGSNASSTSPTPSSCCRATAARPRTGRSRGSWRTRRWPRRSSGWGGRRAGRRCRCRCATPAGPPRRCAPGCPRPSRTPPRRRARPASRWPWSAGCAPGTGG
jgi:energy-coupling factor transporter ATP-binding protein EcfA2